MEFLVGTGRLGALWYDVVRHGFESRYWASLAEYDLETAGAMLRTARHLYVGFMCHQAVEKMLKAAW